MENTQKYYGLKELNSVVIKAYKDITIGNKHFSEGEPILYFEKIQISELKENSKIVAARGGRGNYPHVIWEDFDNFSFVLSEGVLSNTSFSILSNAGVLNIKKEKILLSYQKDSNWKFIMVRLKQCINHCKKNALFIF